MHALLPKFLSYILTGGVAAIVDAGGFALLTKFNCAIVTASVVSFCVAALVNYQLTSRYVFASVTTAPGFARFFVGALAGLVINVGVTLFGVYALSLQPLGAKAAGIGTAFLFNFLINALIVFRVESQGRKRA